MQANFLGVNFKFRKREKFAAACLRPPQNVKLGIFTSQSRKDGEEMYEKSVMHVQSCCFVVLLVVTTAHKPNRVIGITNSRLSGQHPYTVCKQ